MFFKFLCSYYLVLTTVGLPRQTGQVARETHPRREPPHESGDFDSANGPLPGRSPRGGGEEPASRLVTLPISAEFLHQSKLEGGAIFVSTWRGVVLHDIFLALVLHCLPRNHSVCA